MAIQTIIKMILTSTMTKGDRIPKKQTLKVVIATTRIETNAVAVSCAKVSRGSGKGRLGIALRSKMFQANVDVLA